MNAFKIAAAVGGVVVTLILAALSGVGGYYAFRAHQEDATDSTKTAVTKLETWKEGSLRAELNAIYAKENALESSVSAERAEVAAARADNLNAQSAAKTGIELAETRLKVQLEGINVSLRYITQTLEEVKGQTKHPQQNGAN